jgi:hypothetical protein
MYKISDQHPNDHSNNNKNREPVSFHNNQRVYKDCRKSGKKPIRGLLIHEISPEATPLEHTRKRNAL